MAKEFDPAGSSGVFGWDWSQTTHLHAPDAVPTLLEALGSSYAVPGKGLQGWERSAQGFDEQGYAVGTVYFGGPRGDVHVRSTSGAAHNARHAVAGLYEAKTARVDTRVDTLKTFDELALILEDAANMYGTQIIRYESERNRQSTGRTIYLGAPTSAIRVRLYEKWLESPGEYVPGTNRVEVQLRPASRVKEVVSSWTPAETFCASRVTRALADQLAGDLVPTKTLHVARRAPDIERAIEAMGEQYSGAVHRYLEWSGGDIGTLMAYLLREHNTTLRDLDEARSAGSLGEAETQHRHENAQSRTGEDQH